jgi:hypothetical protein
MTLVRYIGAEKLAERKDLLADTSTIEELVSPLKMPSARWPSPGGHPLVTLQQAAVNAARSEFSADSAGIFAINGPPGTGKTTLLRDIVASCVMDRAIAMAGFDDPLAAFKTSGQKIAAGDHAFFHLYRLDESLRGHEVLVASSNNKAVENVSKELPSTKAVGRDFSYFRTVSDRLQARRADDGSLIAGEPTWGLIAAVLGNAINRNAFQQAMWWDDDRSFRLYLKAAKGDAVIREIVDESGKVLRREIPSVVINEAPPTPEQAKSNWKKARQNFKSIHAEVNAELRKLEAVRQTCKQLTEAHRVMSIAETERDLASEALDSYLHETAITAQARKLAQGIAEAAARLEQQSMSQRPGWFARLFRTARFKAWLECHEPFASNKTATAAQFARTVSAHTSAESRASAAQAALKTSEDHLAVAAKAFASLESTVEAHRKALGDRIVDDQFFRQGHEQWNLSAPWVPDFLHSKREELFSAALAVHRAFIDVTAQKISHNLGVLMGAMQAGAFQDESKKSLLGDLWSTLFLVVPAVSTTFASVDRMLGDLPPSSLGWLLIDEAGQATPQSAVGALMRAKRAIVVGDPLQIPPVVSLPERLVSEISKYFKVTQSEWAAPEASVQTLADEASHLQAEFRTDSDPRRVGFPLLVHRRCQEPMFGISNRIAYDGQMVQAVAHSGPGAIEQSIGGSVWLDIDGNATSKWCAVEGEVVVRLLSQLASSGLRQPDVYIITPFRIVAQEMRRRLESESRLFETFEVDAEEWIKNRVGTIHTFQGKEAEAVIAVLGAPMAAQQGARRWASSTPNILNVMVSRAKQNLYVVGSRAAWGSIGHCRTLASTLPIRKA